MITSRRAVASMLQFMIGLILAIMVILFFSKLIYSCLKPEDKSSKTFQELAQRIENLSQNSELQKELNPMFINIGSDELMLFFDKEENYSVYLKGDLNLDSTDLFFNYREQPLNYFKDKQNLEAWGIYVFKKPTSCGESACMVLCPRTGFDIIFYKNLDVKFSDYEVKLQDAFLAFCSQPKQLRVLDKVNKFYRKPYYGECRSSNVVTGGAIVMRRSSLTPFPPPLIKKPEAVTLRFNRVILPGAFLRTSCFAPISRPAKDLTKDLDKFGKSEFKFSFASRDYVSEYKDGYWDNITVLPNQYLYIQAFNNNIVLCYSPPCLSMADEFYINLNNYIGTCLASSKDCASLAVVLEKQAEDKVLFRTRMNNLTVIIGEQGFVFNKNLDLVILFEKDDGTEESISVTELSLEYDYDAAVKQVRLEAGGKKYSFIGMSSDKEDSKSRLKFLVRQYKEAS